MNDVLEWVKANVFIVVFAVLMIAALVTLPLFSRGMNADVRQKVEQRARQLNNLSQLERTSVAPPGGAGTGETRQMLVNERLLQEYREVVRIAQDDADLVHAAALEHNQKGRTVLMENVFPAPPSRDREVMPRRFHERLMAAYEDLLSEVRAGSPPELDSLREDIERREIQFRTQTLSKDLDDPLTDEEQEQLTEALSRVRLTHYQEAAERIAMYASRDILSVPRFDSGRLPSMSELYEWQWQYWIQQDVLRALYDANSDYPSLLQAPVKHVLWVGVLDESPGSREGGGGGGGQMGGAMGGAVGGGAAGGQQGGPPAQAPNPSVEAPLDFSVSFTGRVTNPLYDVRYVDLEVIVDTTRIPAVLDSLARYNFMTVIQLRKRPADPYEAAQGGYYYGTSPVSHLTIRLETVWFREWMARYMPADVKRRLGVPEQDPSAAPGAGDLG